MDWTALGYVLSLIVGVFIGVIVLGVGYNLKNEKEKTPDAD